MYQRIGGGDSASESTTPSGLEKAGVSVPIERRVMVWAAGRQDIYQVAAGGAILRSSDGGERWTLLQSGTRADLSCVWGADPECVFVVGDGGLVRSTRDRGWSFTTHESGTGARLHSIHGDGLHLVAVGAGGTVLVSDDGGMRWDGIDSGTRHHLHGCWRLGDGAILVAGEHGALLRSGDGEDDTVRLRPVRLHPGLDGHLLALHCEGDRVVAVGARGLVLRSDDGGRHFERMTSVTSAPLRAVWGGGALIVAVGDRGTVVYSEDGGATWGSEVISYRGDFSGVCSLGERDLLLVGPEGMILRIDW